MSLEPIKKVLVAMDGSERSYEIIHYITRTRLFAHQKTRICLFSVYETVPDHLADLGRDPRFHQAYAGVKQWELQKKREIEGFLEKARNRLISCGIPARDISVKAQIKEVGIARDIIQEASDGYDALMIGRKGEGMLKYIMMGSVAMKLLSAIHDIPLAIIGRNIPETPKLIVALDQSEYGMKAVHFVAANFPGQTFHVHLIHAIRDDIYTPPEITERYVRSILPFFDNAKACLMEHGFEDQRITTNIVTKQRSRARTIMDEADNAQVGTIVTGRRGLSKVMEFFMGRVSNKIVQMGTDNAVWVIS